ncbi:hypothetical protein C8J28_13412 [Cereibacter azotoformans]|uniref:Uncharacterized protein n=1 Tax=Cereibacter azotoformans TaxID=43057 RepID=A0A2T5JN81_9RHOB|nr:hypothetical protein C8J28_13412 [Cereibacter azotoformans]
MKTWKREVALGLLAYCAGLGAYVAWTGSAAGMSVLELWLPGSYLFAAGAFGLDSWSKQVRPPQGPQG